MGENLQLSAEIVEAMKPKLREARAAIVAGLSGSPRLDHTGPLKMLCELLDDPDIVLLEQVAIALHALKLDRAREDETGALEA